MLLIKHNRPCNSLLGRVSREVAIILQWKVREGVSEEVILNLKLNDRKKTFRAKILGRGRRNYEYEDIKGDTLGASGPEKDLIGSEVREQGRC